MKRFRIFFLILPAILFLLIFCDHHEQLEQQTNLLINQLGLADSLSHSRPEKADSVYRLILTDTLSGWSRVKVRALIGLSEIYSIRLKYDSSDILIGSSFSIASTLKDTSLMMDCLLTHGNFDIDLGEFVKAEICFLKGLELAKKSGSIKQQHSFVLGLGAVQKEKGDYTTAIKSFTEAARMAELSGNIQNQALALENIGLTLKSTNDYDDAVVYLKKAIDLRKKANLWREYAMGLHNLGILYRNMGAPDSALANYRIAGEVFTALNDSNNLVKVRYNTGLVLKNQKKYQESMQIMMQVLKICRLNGLSEGRLLVYTTIASLYDLLGDPGKGIVYIDSSISLAKTTNNIENLPAFYDRKHEFLASTGNYREAYALSLRSRELADSLLSLDKQKEIAGIRTRFETDRKEAENVILKKSIEVQDAKLWMLFFAMAFLLLLGTAVTLIMVNRQQREKQQKQIAEEKVIRVEREKKIQEVELEKSHAENQLREQALFFQTLARNDLAKTNKSAREKLAPFIYRMSRKKDQSEFQKLINEIARDSHKDPLAEFEQIFSHLHNSFYAKLITRNSEFTRTELEVAAMIRLNFSSKDIARLTGLSVATIDTTRYHIRRKLGLGTGDNLTSYMMTI